MNPALTPGFQLTDNLLLTEELPAPPDAAFRVWYAFNVQLGRIVVVKVHPDGQVEPVGSDAPAMVTPMVSAAPAPVAAPTPAPVNYVPPVPPRPPVYQAPPPANPYGQAYPYGTPGPTMPESRPPRRNQRWLKYAIWLVVVAGGAYALYFYRRPVKKYYWKTVALIQANFKPSTLPTDTTSKPQSNSPTAPVEGGPVLDDKPAWSGNGGQTTDSTAMVIEEAPAKVADPEPGEVDMMKLPPPPVDPNEPPVAGPASAPITAEQAVKMLSRLSIIPARKHPDIFRDARLAFEAYRQNGGRQTYIDEHYVAYMGRAAQSVMAYQQNGDAVSKQYALNWYQTAYALKPSSDLAGRIERLKNNTPKTQAKPQPKLQRKPPRSTGRVLFEDDPEVN